MAIKSSLRRLLYQTEMRIQYRRFSAQPEPARGWPILLGMGAPVHVLLKCTTSPHIYRLENDKKRWIKDIPTLLAEGHRWEDVRFIPCDELRSIPDGPPIPPDAGPAPQP